MLREIHHEIQRYWQLLLKATFKAPLVKKPEMLSTSAAPVAMLVFFSKPLQFNAMRISSNYSRFVKTCMLEERGMKNCGEL